MRNDGRFLFALLICSLVSPLVPPVQAGSALMVFGPLVVDPRYGRNATWGFTATASGSLQLSQVSLRLVKVYRTTPYYDGQSLRSIMITPSRYELGEIPPGETRGGQLNVSLGSDVDPGYYQVSFILSHSDQYGSLQNQTFTGSVKVSAVENPRELSMSASLSKDAASMIVHLERNDGTAVSLGLIEVCSYQRTWVLLNIAWTNSSGTAVVGLGGWARFGGYLTVFYSLRMYTCGGSVGSGPLHVGIEVFVPSAPLWPDFLWTWVVAMWAMFGTAVTATAFAIESRKGRKLDLIS